jgi:thiamine biosynthesis lipoprotein
MSLSGEDATPLRGAAAEQLHPQQLQRARPLLGTIVSIRIRGVGAEEAGAAMAGGFAAIAEVHRLMSFHEETSDVSRLNREALERAVAVDAHTLRVLRRALEFAAESSGAFDVTVARELVEFGLLPRPPARFAPDAAASWRDIELLPDGRVRFHRPLWIDLGGIAKGYAVDQAMAQMTDIAQAQLCINAGGDLRVRGCESESVCLKIGLAQEAMPIVTLQDASLASSSGRGIGRLHAGRRVGPHIHGVRRSVMGLRSFVCVIAPECLVADALTKIVMARGVRCAGLLRRLDATAYLHDAHNGWRTVGAGA